MASNLAADRQRGAVGRPVGVGHTVQHLARGATAQGHAGQPSGRSEFRIKQSVERDRQFSGGGNTQDAGREIERLRLGRIRARRKKLGRLAVGGGVVHDGASIGSEPRMAEEGGAEGDLGERRMAGRWTQQPGCDHADRQRRQQRCRKQDSRSCLLCVLQRAQPGA